MNLRGRRPPLNLSGLVFIAGLFAGGVLTRQAMVGAQTTPASINAHVEFDLEGRPYDILAELHRKSGLNLIADAGFSQQLVHVKLAGTCAKVLDAVCESLDCRWKATKSGLIVLQRRFHQPDELPQANIEELRQTAHDAVLGLKALGVEQGDDQVWHPMLTALANMLTPDQAAALEHGDKLEPGALTESQRQLLTRAILTRAFGGLRAEWEILTSRLDGIDRAVIVAQDPSGPRIGSNLLCGLVLPGVRGGPPVIFGPLPSLNNLDSIPRKSATSPSPKDQPPATPAHHGSDGVAAKISLPPATIDVGAICEALAGQMGSQVDLQPCLRSRRIWAACSGVSANDLLDALCGLYGWRWFKNDDGKIGITRAVVRLPRRPSDMSGYLRGILPADIRDFLFLRPPGDAPAPTWDGYSDAGFLSLSQRQNNVAKRALESLARDFKSAGGTMADLSYSKLPVEEQEIVRLALIMKVFHEEDQQVWYNVRGMQSMDSLDAKIWLDKGEILMVNRFFADGNTGFGANVKR